MFKTLKKMTLICASVLLVAQTSSAAVATGTFTGKCVAMLKTHAFVLSQNTEQEISSIVMIDFDQKKFSYIATDYDRTNNELNRRDGADIPFYLFNDDIAGFYQMRFQDNQDASDYLTLIPSNSSQTIFFMDPVIGSTGVCQKL